jgi:hypothetical protein
MAAKRSTSSGLARSWGPTHSALLEAHKRRLAHWPASSIASLNLKRSAVASGCSPSRQASIRVIYREGALASDQLGGRPFFIVGVVARPVPTQPAFSISSTATKRAWALSSSSASLVHECAKSTKVLVISALGEASAIRRQLRACLRHSLGSPGIGTIPLADRLLSTPH